MITSVDQLPVDGRRVFIRVDLNVPLENGEVADDTRIQAALPTIRHCLERDSRVVLASHLGRPKGQVVPELSLEPVAAYLSQLLDIDILLTDEPAGDGAGKVVSDLRHGHVAVLENLRFNPGETANDENFARALASYADVYINDAFGTAHRAHASTVGMVPYVTERGGGFLMAREVEQLSKLLGEVERPYVAIIGGAKVKGKIEVLDALLERVDRILIGGAMANTFLAAQGVDMGASKLEEDKLPLARNFLRKASRARGRGRAADRRRHLPGDRRPRAGASRLGPRDRLGADGPRHRTCDHRDLRRRGRPGANHLLERADGRVRARRVRQWNQSARVRGRQQPARVLGGWRRRQRRGGQGGRVGRQDFARVDRRRRVARVRSRHHLARHPRASELSPLHWL